MKILKSIILIIIIIFGFDILINLLLPENLKKKIGTTRNYSLKSEEFHHAIAPKIDVNEFWGKNKYKVKTNEYSMRISENEEFFIDKNKEYVAFVGDSFVYGSGINYEDHFISLLDKKKYDYLNLGFVSYSPSIYFKKIKYLIEKKNLTFKKIFIFIDHSDIQDEGLFYRENSKGNIVRNWLNDEEIYKKNLKYKVKNYLKQNSFIFKLYENLNNPTISTKTSECIKQDKINLNYNEFIDLERFGYGYKNNLKNKKWEEIGKKKIIEYLQKIKDLSLKHNFEIVIINYPSAPEVINSISSKDTEHFNFLNNWSSKNNITFINTRDDFIVEKNINDYLNNFIHCDVHWNKNGHKIISENIKNFLYE